ncbi:MAG: SEL1-like repeat protein [Oscillospiraceae bacterium]|nr:SEL1-like repeat protein [Oscillospiraceae bacterium]
MSEETVFNVQEIESTDPKNPDTQFELAQHYFKGTGTKQDYARALEWYTKAAEQGHAGAMFKVGQCFYKGLGTDEDRAEALKWYEKAGDSGHSQAAFAAGQMYYTGDGTDKDIYKAKAWLEESREHKGYDLLYDINKELGTKLTTKEINAKIDELEAEAEKGDESAMLELAEWYSNGKNLRPNMEAARIWASQAYEMNSWRAPHQMGVILERQGDPRGAIEWFRKGAEEDDSNAQYKLATYILEGKYTERNLDEAFELLRQVYNEGPSGFIYDRDKANRMFWDLEKMLGPNYIPREEREELEELESKAKNGDKLSMLMLSDKYLEGEDYIKQDLDKARYWANAALNAGSIGAYKQMADICRAANDDSGMLSWLQKGVDKGSVDCMYKLGWEYYTGASVQKDLKKALELLGKAKEEVSQIRNTLYDVSYIARDYERVKKELEAQTPHKAEEKKEEKKEVKREEKKKVQSSGSPVSTHSEPVTYKEPVTFELCAIAAALIVCGLAVLFMKIGAGKYGNEAVIVVKGFKKVLLQIVCIGGIIGLSGVSLGLVSLSFFDEYGLGAFIGHALGIGAVIFLGANYVTARYIYIVVGIIVAVMFIRIIHLRTKGS